MKDKVLSIGEGVTIALASALGLTQIESVLGIIILVVQIAWILFKIVNAIIKYYKNKHSEKDMTEDIVDAINELEDLSRKKELIEDVERTDKE